MASDNKFVYAKTTIDIKRSKWNMNHRIQGSIFHGDLVPLEITEVLPGDSFKYRLKNLTRTATPFIAPLMDNIYENFAAFFIPKRLIFNKTKEFYGENVEGYGVQTEVLEPRMVGSGASIYVGGVAAQPQTFSSYLGLVRQTNGPTGWTPINLLPIRAYLQVYNDWFRNENFHAPYLWNHDQVGDSASYVFATLNGSNINGMSDVPKVCKKLDRFTSCLPWAQKSNSSVLLPLGSAASVTISSDGPLQLSLDNGDKIGNLSNPADSYPDNVAWSNISSYVPSQNEAYQFAGGLKGTADLSTATAATINQLRMAFATQKYLEQLARTGSRYREYIKGMFGVDTADSSIQMAEFLGGISRRINIAPIYQGTDFAAGSTTKLGAVGGVSETHGDDYLFTKSFTEPGYLVIVYYTKHDRTYGQGILDIYRKHEIFDYYNPKFANIGEQAIKKSDLFFSGFETSDNAEFGFQEPWSGYRYIPDRSFGLLNPANTSSYNFWNLGEKFAAAPTLNGDFLKENRDYIARALAGGTASPDYFLDVYVEATVVRPMPLYSVPGLIDHH